MEPRTYKPAYVAGMLRIQERTLEQHVKLFRTFFSATAGQRARGRRFTDADIETESKILRAYNYGCNTDEVSSVLSGEFNIPLITVFREEHIKTLAVNALENLSSANGIIQKAEVEFQENKQVFESMVRDMDIIRSENKTLKRIIHEMRQWQVYAMKTHKIHGPEGMEVLAIEQELAEEQAQVNPITKKTGIFSGLFKTQ